MNVRMYKAPSGRVENIEVFIDCEDAAQIAAMLERHVYPAVEMLSTGECSVTLEADDLQEDLVCRIVRPDQIIGAIHRMVRAFSVPDYDAHYGKECQ